MWICIEILKHSIYFLHVRNKIKTIIKIKEMLHYQTISAVNETKKWHNTPDNNYPWLVSIASNPIKKYAYMAKHVKSKLQIFF